MKSINLFGSGICTVACIVSFMNQEYFMYVLLLGLAVINFHLGVTDGKK